MFPTDEETCYTESQFVNAFRSDLQIPDADISFIIDYEAINIHRVKLTGELKFTAKVDMGKTNCDNSDKIYFTEPTKVSNWIGKLEVV